MSKGLKRLNDSGRMDVPSILYDIPGTIVDWDIYDDATSPDGGAWRKKTAHTSWYNEPLNTATRGSKREFPARALVTAEAAKVTIWDITSGQPEMWRVFTFASDASSLSSVVFSGGEMWVGADNTTGTGALWEVNFVHNAARLHQDVAINQALPIWANDITQLNSSGSSWISPPAIRVSQALVNRITNSVAMTILPDAPLDDYGMRVPTIAVATNGGVSVIKHDGSVVNITHTGYSVISGVMFTSTNGIAYITDIAGFGGRWLHVDNVIPTSNLTKPVGYVGTGSDQMYHTVLGSVYPGTSLYLLASSNISGVVNNAVSGSWGVSVLHKNPTTPANGMVAYLTNTYNTGWLIGDIRRAFLCNSLTADRSVKGGTLTVNGTITETVNAGGVNVYSGFSATNYFSEANNADWNALGTGDFSIVMSVTIPSNHNTLGYILEVGEVAVNSNFAVVCQSSGGITFHINGDAPITSSARLGQLVHIVALRRSGVKELYVNGSLIGSLSNITSVSNANATLRIGNRAFDGTNIFDGQVAQVRISATAPTAEQIKHMYETERKLFEPNAQALLSNSASVSDLRYDKTTDLYAVTNGTNTDVFKDLTRIDSAATGSKLNAPITTMSGNTLIAPAESIVSSIRSIRSKPARRVLLDFNVVVNGKFSTASGWTLNAGWSIVGGQLVAAAAALNTNTTLPIPIKGAGNKSYIVSYDIPSFTAGSFSVRLTEYTTSVTDNGTTRTGTGSFFETGRTLPHPLELVQLFGWSASNSFTVDNIVIRESTNTLPPGFKPTKVWAGGMLQEEGTDYDVTFDGFLYGVNFFIEPATNVQVEGEYI